MHSISDANSVNIPMITEATRVVFTHSAAPQYGIGLSLVNGCVSIAPVLFESNAGPNVKGQRLMYVGDVPIDILRLYVSVYQAFRDLMSRIAAGETITNQGSDTQFWASLVPEAHAVYSFNV